MIGTYPGGSEGPYQREVEATFFLAWWPLVVYMHCLHLFPSAESLNPFIPDLP